MSLEYDPLLILLATLLSNLRITISYFFSLTAAISLGVKAGLDPRAERVIIPVVDVLQSVPVMGFFPVAVYVLVESFPGWLGWELASIFLIFTSQAWNMILGVYQSTKTLPEDIVLASRVYGVRGLVFIRRVALPAATPSLIYNSMVSWTSSWFFVTASEIISLGSRQYKLLGLGSLIAEAAINADYLTLGVGVVAMLVSILSVMLLVWNPLLTKSRRIGFGPESRLEVYSVDALIKSLTRVYRGLASLLAPLSSTATSVGSVIYNMFRRVLPATMIALIAWAVYTNIPNVLSSLVELASLETLVTASVATLYTLARLSLAYLISLAWIIPLGLLVLKRRLAYATVLTVAEVLSGVPATIWYPLAVVLIQEYNAPPDVVSIALLLTGMQWYIFFNFMAGIRSIPEDLEVMSRVYNIKGLLYVRKLLLPSALPFIVTGSNAGWGGAWNATIVAEYIIGEETYLVYGLGGLITSSALAGEVAKLVFYVAWMVLVVLLINRLVWLRLYGYVARRVRLEA